MKLFIYLTLLIFIIIFCVFLQNKNINKSPSKIKIYYNIILSMALIRYSILFISAINNNQSIMVHIKSLSLLNYIFVPALGLASVYIFLREDKMKFSYNIILFSMITIGYIFLVLIYKIEINIDRDIGFIFNFKENLNPNLVYLIMLSMIVVVSMLNMDGKYTNKNGIIFLILGTSLLMVELIASLASIKVFNYQLFGEIMLLIVTNKAINTFKTQNSI